MAGHSLLLVTGAEALTASLAGFKQARGGATSTLAWVTTGAYTLAAFLCLWAMLRRGAQRDGRSGNSAMLWLAFGIVMLVLAAIRQLDMLAWLWQLGKSFAKAYGLYEERRVIQIALLGLVSVAVTGVFLYMLRVTRGCVIEDTMALCGILFILGFASIRATSLHYFDIALEWHAGGVTLSWALENSGILMVIAAALLAIRRVPPVHYIQFDKPAYGGTGTSQARPGKKIIVFRDVDD
ncbi:MAG: hypothetical protein K1Y02_03740 [Candidatus Hydrogenedentes bacterium]|nr:hypothetical protein [Candidatus Hydrogenedentota bacterium]